MNKALKISNLRNCPSADYGSEGLGFESLWVRHFFIRFTSTNPREARVVITDSHQHYTRERLHSRLGYLRTEDFIKDPKFSVLAQTWHPVSPLRLPSIFLGRTI